MNRKSQILFLIVLILLTGISQAQEKASQFPILKGSYLGQKPPGMKPEIFAPGIINTNNKNHSCVAIAPDGKELYWSQFSSISGIRQERIWFTQIKGGIWTPPRVAPFSGEFREGGPQFSPDGNRLYFASQRPTNEYDTTNDANIWFIEKTEMGWSEPKSLGRPVNSQYEEWFPSVAKNGNIYYMFRQSDTDELWDIYCSRFTDGKYTNPERLGAAINSQYVEGFSFVNPDERFLIFYSERPGGCCKDGELYISFKNQDGTWADAINMGNRINSEGSRFPGISPDSRFFFFANRKSGTEDIYWMNSTIIDELKPDKLR